LSRITARGYVPLEVQIPSYETVVSTLAETSSDLPSALWIFPTTLGRLASNSNVVDDLFPAMADQLNRFKPGEVTVVVGIQYQDVYQQTEARQLAQRIAAIFVRASIPVLTMAVNARRKLATLNIALQVTSHLPYTAVGWVDDDVVLSDNCLMKLWERARDPKFSGAIGAHKIGSPENCTSSKILHLLKGITKPATDYPHGCCIIVDRQVVGSGIPWKYYSEDGYICFSLIDIENVDPLHRLVIEHKAFCYHKVGTTGLWSNMRRIRRLLLNHNILIADSRPEVARYYTRKLLFHGMWPYSPLSTEIRLSTATLRAILKWLYFGFYSAVKLELIIRGLIGRPLRTVTWGTMT